MNASREENGVSLASPLDGPSKRASLLLVDDPAGVAAEPAIYTDDFADAVQRCSGSGQT